MSESQMKGLQYFVIIASHKKKDKLLRLLGEHGAHGIDIVYGHGSAGVNALAAVFGFEEEHGKALISCLIKRDNARELLEILCNDHDFDKPNTGIAFSIPVEGLAF